MAEKKAWHYLVLFCREDDDEDPQPLAAFWDMSEAKAFAERYRKQIGLVHVHEWSEHGSWASTGWCSIETFIDAGPDAYDWPEDGGETAYVRMAGGGADGGEIAD